MHNVNFTKNSKSYKIRNFSPISVKLRIETTEILSTIMKKYLARNVNIAELGAKMPFYRKIQNFIKFERSEGFFSKFNPTRP